MSDQLTTAPQELYEGFMVHIVPSPTWANSSRYTYTGYVYRPGVDPWLPGHVVSLHTGGDDTFRSLEEAMGEAVHVARSIVDGTHPDPSALSIVTHGY